MCCIEYSLIIYMMSIERYPYSSKYLGLRFIRCEMFEHNDNGQQVTVYPLLKNKTKNIEMYTT